MHEEGEDLRDFARRVRSLGEVANTNLGAQTRDDMNREQFTDGLCDFELQELLLREDLEIFNQAVARAQALDMARKTSQVEESETAKSRSVGARCSRPDD